MNGPERDGPRRPSNFERLREMLVYPANMPFGCLAFMVVVGLAIAGAMLWFIIVAASQA